MGGLPESYGIYSIYNGWFCDVKKRKTKYGTKIIPIYSNNLGSEKIFQGENEFVQKIFIDLETKYPDLIDCAKVVMINDSSSKSSASASDDNDDDDDDDFSFRYSYDYGLDFGGGSNGDDGSGSRSGDGKGCGCINVYSYSDDSGFGSGVSYNRNDGFVCTFLDGERSGQRLDFGNYIENCCGQGKGSGECDGSGNG